MTYFVTGATGFIGRHLVEQLLKRDGDIHVLVREGSTDKLDELIRRWGPEASARIKPVDGDLAEPRLGVADDQVEALKGQIDHFFHLAAIYDMTADDERNEQLNVEGTRNAVELANALEAGVLHHTSSIAAAGNYKGLFREDMFDEGQKLPSAYHRTKFESEKIARTKSKVPWRVYRPAIVVGHSETGEMDKIDGPYYFFKLIQKLRGWLPEWFPLVGPELGYTNIVPVDYVAKAMDHIAHQPDLDGQAFHLTNPRRQRSGEVLNIFGEAAHAPQMQLRVDKRIIDALPKGVISMAMQAPPLKDARKAVLADFGIPEEVVEHVGLRPEFDTRDTERALKGSGIEVPELDDVRRQAVGLLGAQPRPGPVQGPLVRGRGQRQARAHHRRVLGHRPGGGDEDREGRRHPAARRARRGEARGGQGRDREAGRDRVRLPGRPRRPRLDRRARREDPRPTTRRSTSSSTTPAARSVARSG